MSLIDTSEMKQTKAEEKEPDPVLALLYLISGQVVLGKVISIEDPDDVSKTALLVDHGLDINQVKNQHGQVIAAAMIPYGSLGCLPPLKQAIFKDSHVMHVSLNIPQNFADDYVKATSGIQIAR